MKNICMPFKGPSQLLEIVLDLGAYLYCKISGKAPFLSYYSKKKKKKTQRGEGTFDLSPATSSRNRLLSLVNSNEFLLFHFRQYMT